MHLARMKKKDTYRQCVHGKRHRERKWTIERFERMRNRVRTGQFSREGADAVSFRKKPRFYREPHNPQLLLGPTS